MPLSSDPMAEASDNMRMVPARVPRAPTKIGDLPEDILLRIMSHPTSREAVQTCLGSRYWRDLWRSVPCIDVSIEEFEGRSVPCINVPIEELEAEHDDDDTSMEEFESDDDDDDDDDDSEPVDESMEESEGEDEDEDVEPMNLSMREMQDFEREVVFKRFVNRLLTLRNPVALDKFRLRYSYVTGNRSDSQVANNWISHALQCNARVVQVLNRFQPLELVSAIFTSSRLNRLHITSAVLVPGFFTQLQTGCPALEYMFLHDCSILDLEIFSSTLKILILTDEVKFSFDPDQSASISAPSLISLSINHGLSGARLPILNNMPSLKTASISLWGGYIETCDSVGIKQFLRGLSDVTSLDFCYGDRKLTMEKSFQWCPTFRELINLTLNCSCVDENLYALIVFLQNSPNLKRLTLKLGRSDNSAITGELEDRSFTCEQLEIVEIICWGRSELLPRLTQLLHAGGITADQMRISHQY
uniref:Uncharacterized protein n=2 Tax=Avena sativa TaxID=4498 RepID=A0ACD6AID3_AVESA